MFSDGRYQQYHFDGTTTKYTVLSNAARRILNIISKDFSYKKLYASDNAGNDNATAKIMSLQKHQKGESGINSIEKSFGSDIPPILLLDNLNLSGFSKYHGVYAFSLLLTTFIVLVLICTNIYSQFSINERLLKSENLAPELKTSSELLVSNDNENQSSYNSTLNPNAYVFIPNMNLNSFNSVGCHKSDYFDLNNTPLSRSNLNPNAAIFQSLDNPTDLILNHDITPHIF